MAEKRNETIAEGMHNLTLENRRNLVLTGVTDVENFDENSILLYTQLGELEIKGRNLHINAMNVETGDVSVEGDVWSFVYSDRRQKGKGGALSKLFK